MAPFSLLLVLLGLSPWKAAGLAPPVERVGDSIIQICIVPKTRGLMLRPEGSFSVIDMRTGQAHQLRNRKDYELQAAARGFLIGPHRFDAMARLSSLDPDASIWVNAQRYRGSLLIKSNRDDTLAVIDEMGLEEYLYGVLPAEMSPDWPLEALKAQAVVARTFALNNMGKFQASGFDLSNDSRSQVFTGMGQESPRVLEAVQKTRGEVLAWNGKLLKAFFHSCCGGHTSDYASVWGPAAVPKPLRGVSDRYCKDSPQYAWTAYVTQDDILAALQKHGHDAVRLRNIRIGRRDGAGFVRALHFIAKGKTIEVRAGDFRDWIGNTDIKSTKFHRIVKRSQGYEFIGRGYGHGVGLCQWGANIMAQRGKNYRKILQHYFPGAVLAQYEG